MTGTWWWDLVIGLVVALVVSWLALVAALAVVRPPGGRLRESLRLLPDMLRLVRRPDPAARRTDGIVWAVRQNGLAGPTGEQQSMAQTLRPLCRWGLRLRLLLAYLAFPLDHIPDFIPVLGYADGAIIVAAVLRSVVRRAGMAAVERHWPGSADGFAARVRLTGLSVGPG
ncbi:YkvA family protein [Nonomuraea jabiensis]|uniref:YkvA family protein n=1 Tax=Nonomuraea jabiensis TaxID=882448 RepID=UPI003D705AAD